MSYCTFIGPDAEIIQKMGHKSQARNTMIAAGIPVIPGSTEPIYDADTAPGSRILSDILSL